MKTHRYAVVASTVLFCVLTRSSVAQDKPPFFKSLELRTALAEHEKAVKKPTWSCRLREFARKVKQEGRVCDGLQQWHFSF